MTIEGLTSYLSQYAATKGDDSVVSWLLQLFDALLWKYLEFVPSNLPISGSARVVSDAQGELDALYHDLALKAFVKLAQILSKLLNFEAVSIKFDRSCLITHMANQFQSLIFNPAGEINHPASRSGQIGASLVCKLASELSEEISLWGYDVWLSLAVKGLAHFDGIIQKNCMQAFRLMVPYAPLGLNRISKQDNRSDSSGFNTKPSIIQELLAKQRPPRLIDSENCSDQTICQLLDCFSNINVFNGDITEAVGSNRYHLRSYQWEGITWWTALRRCGLSGILADEM
jgi:hypothetical protein